MGILGRALMRNLEQVESLQRTNPEIDLWPWLLRSDYCFGMNTQLPPFDDIRVRKAMQMALDLEKINLTFFKGYGDPVPQGLLSRDLGPEFATPFEEWPEEVKKGYTYDPAGAEALLDEAGLPRDADGIRFKTELLWPSSRPVSYAELAAAYWGEIGVDVEIDIDDAVFTARKVSRDFEMVAAEGAIHGAPPQLITTYPLPVFMTDTVWNSSNVSDPVYDAMYEAGSAPATDEERNRIAKEMNMYAIESFWQVWGPIVPAFSAVQPWLIGWNGEWVNHGGIDILARLWIDSELKEAMGH